MTRRPTFQAAWAAATRIYDPKDPGGAVKRIIGGKVAANVAPEGTWTNFCAVRMSYILNQTRVRIPFTTGKTVSGANRDWYFHYVRDVITFLKGTWGNPDITAPYPPDGGGSLQGQQGLVLFEIDGWQDAVGHATLWNGRSCYDHCYFDEAGADYTSRAANFWKLA